MLAATLANVEHRAGLCLQAVGNQLRHRLLPSCLYTYQGMNSPRLVSTVILTVWFITINSGPTLSTISAVTRKAKITEPRADCQQDIAHCYSACTFLLRRHKTCAPYVSTPVGFECHNSCLEWNVVYPGRNSTTFRRNVQPRSSSGLMGKPLCRTTRRHILEDANLKTLLWGFCLQPASCLWLPGGTIGPWRWKQCAPPSFLLFCRNIRCYTPDDCTCKRYSRSKLLSFSSVV
jgi:hypothetical protein